MVAIYSLAALSLSSFFRFHVTIPRVLSSLLPRVRSLWRLAKCLRGRAEVFDREKVNDVRDWEESDRAFIMYSAHRAININKHMPSNNWLMANLASCSLRTLLIANSVGIHHFQTSLVPGRQNQFLQKLICILAECWTSNSSANTEKYHRSNAYLNQDKLVMKM